MAARPKRPSGSGAAYRAERQPASSSSLGVLAGVAFLVVALTAAVTTVVIKGNQGADAGPAGTVAPDPGPAAAGDPFASVPRAGRDLGGDDVASFDEKVGDDSVTLAFPKFFSYRRRPGGMADGVCFVLKGREKSCVVWVVGSFRDAVATADLLREVQLEPGSRTGVRPQSQRLGPVMGTGERFTIPGDPEPLEGLVLRAGYGTDREVVGLGVAPARSTQLRSVVDAILGSLRAEKFQGTRAVGGLTYLPRK